MSGGQYSVGPMHQLHQNSLPVVNGQAQISRVHFTQYPPDDQLKGLGMANCRLISVIVFSLLSHAFTSNLKVEAESDWVQLANVPADRHSCNEQNHAENDPNVRQEFEKTELYSSWMDDDYVLFGRIVPPLLHLIQDSVSECCSLAVNTKNSADTATVEQLPLGGNATIRQFGLDFNVGDLSRRDLQRLKSLGLYSIIGEVTMVQFRRLREMLLDLEFAQSQSLLDSVLIGKMDFLGNFAYSIVLNLYSNKPGSRLLDYLCMDYPRDKIAHRRAIKRYLDTAIKLAKADGSIKSCYFEEYRKIIAVYPSVHVVKQFYPLISKPHTSRVVADVLNLPFDRTDNNFEPTLHDIISSIPKFGLNMNEFMASPISLQYSAEDYCKMRVRNEAIMKASSIFESFACANVVKYGTVSQLHLLSARMVVALLGHQIEGIIMCITTCSVIWARMDTEADIKQFWINYSSNVISKISSALAAFIVKPEAYWSSMPPSPNGLYSIIARTMPYARKLLNSSYGARFLASMLAFCKNEMLATRSNYENGQFLNVLPQTIFVAYEMNQADDAALFYEHYRLSTYSDSHHHILQLEPLCKSALWFGLAGELFLKSANRHTIQHNEIWIEIFNRILFHALVTGKKTVLDSIKCHTHRTEMMACALAKGAIPTSFLVKFFDALCDWPTFTQESFAEFLSVLIETVRQSLPQKSIPFGLTERSLALLLSSKIRK